MGSTQTFDQETNCVVNYPQIEPCCSHLRVTLHLLRNTKGLRLKAFLRSISAWDSLLFFDMFYSLSLPSIAAASTVS